MAEAVPRPSPRPLPVPLPLPQCLAAPAQYPQILLTPRGKAVRIICLAPASTPQRLRLTLFTRNATAISCSSPVQDSSTSSANPIRADSASVRWHLQRTALPRGATTFDGSTNPVASPKPSIPAIKLCPAVLCRRRDRVARKPPAIPGATDSTCKPLCSRMSSLTYVACQLPLQ
ncbi:hypothetical protein P154DRAFT_619032 [Amniculicola lignicola CBS 123094]|uniref:Uncharacterized protein n=1 Tax=Amniculicola lignicola CBS 123094 TaxID=1392246 RepID=A0A6A5WJ90_9PLEO|nr:hypothetical protein P154DRAFT_619032 [Amniculicola lignicola CBS 123094]